MCFCVFRIGGDSKEMQDNPRSMSSSDLSGMVGSIGGSSTNQPSTKMSGPNTPNPMTPNPDMVMGQIKNEPAPPTPATPSQPPSYPVPSPLSGGGQPSRTPNPATPGGRKTPGMGNGGPTFGSPVSSSGPSMVRIQISVTI